MIQCRTLIDTGRTLIDMGHALHPLIRFYNVERDINTDNTL